MSSSLTVMRYRSPGRYSAGRYARHGSSTVTSSTDVRIVDGEVRVDVPVPMTRPVLHADPDGLIGFWFRLLFFGYHQRDFLLFI